MHIIDFFTELYNELELLKDQYKNAYFEYNKNNNNNNNNNNYNYNYNNNTFNNNNNTFNNNNIKNNNLNSNNDTNLDPTNNINNNNNNNNNNNIIEQNNQEIEEENNKFSKKKNHKTNQNFYKETEINEENERESTNKNKIEKNARNENNESNQLNENAKWIKKIFLKLLFIFHPDKNISPDPPKFSLIKNSFENKNYLPLLFHFIQQKNNPFIHNLFLEIHNSQKFLKSLESLSNLLILHINFIKSDPIFLKYHLSSGLK